MTAAITAQTAKQLSELVASAIAGEKAYNVPSICRRYGLTDGSDEEAFRSKLASQTALILDDFGLTIT